MSASLPRGEITARQDVHVAQDARVGAARLLQNARKQPFHMLPFFSDQAPRTHIIKYSIFVQGSVHLGSYEPRSRGCRMTNEGDW
ncbi:hypothetical protein AAFF_G00387520 [Aldrovandia affinis]|uniref:Uncharacterized protein n=1 Tax=Aldrovandia affinis TaxID=143900 RepID=A0AAD7SET2_9TELE|nr:hypothetical protein AAFF_G00387520 [Aldrovandia affinis]